VQIRAAQPPDLEAVRDIYAFHVLNGLASFEEEPPPLAEIRRRYDEVRALALPYLVAEEAGEVLGYAYCALYRARSAYRYSLEDSVYIRDGRQGRGLGKALLAALVARCAALDYRQMIAVIGDSGNAASIRLHASLGFLRVGTLRSAGYKFGRWVDSILMQRPLGPGDMTPPRDGAPGS
jgi:phosphinothricin acetyltransferase